MRGVGVARRNIGTPTARSGSTALPLPGAPFLRHEEVRVDEWTDHRPQILPGLVRL